MAALTQRTAFDRHAKHVLMQFVEDAKPPFERIVLIQFIVVHAGEAFELFGRVPIAEREYLHEVGVANRWLHSATL